MAAAVQGSGRVTTVDHAEAIRSRDPYPTEMFARAGLSESIDLVLVDDSSYTWWLKGQIEQNSDSQGNCTPIYDFCYLDGAHNWTIDGFAVVLIEKLLRPGGWLLLDDLSWTYEGSGAAPTQNAEDLRLSKAEASEPNMQAVFDLIVRQHPSFAETRIQNGDWGWAKKDPSADRTFTVTETFDLRTRALGAVRKFRSRVH